MAGYDLKSKLPQGESLATFAVKLGLQKTLIWRLNESGEVAPNHPALERIAKALKVDPHELVAACRLKPLSAPQLARLATIAKRNAAGVAYRVKDRVERRKPGRPPGPKPGKKLILHPTESTAAKARNKLKRRDVYSRQSIRTIANTLNMAIMDGRDAVLLPTREMSKMLDDHFRRLGIKRVMILDPDYVEAFD